MRARAVEALGAILREGAAISVSPKNPAHAPHQPVTINPVSTKSGAVQVLPIALLLRVIEVQVPQVSEDIENVC